MIYFAFKKYNNNKWRKIYLCTWICILKTTKLFFNSVKTLRCIISAINSLTNETLKSKFSFYSSVLKLGLNFSKFVSDALCLILLFIIIMLKRYRFGPFSNKKEERFKIISYLFIFIKIKIISYLLFLEIS